MHDDPDNYPRVSRAARTAALLFAFVGLPLLFVSWFTWLEPVRAAFGQSGAANVLAGVVLGLGLLWLAWLVLEPALRRLGTWLGRP